MDVLLIALSWLIGCGIVSTGAGARGRNVAGWFFLSIPLSPLLGLTLVLVLADLRREWIALERHNQLLQALGVDRVDGREATPILHPNIRGPRYYN